MSTRKESNNHKYSYTISCSFSFKESLKKITVKRKCNFADIARSVVLMLPEEFIESYNYKEELPTEENTKKSLIRVRLPKGYSSKFIRKALAIAIDQETNNLELHLSKNNILQRYKNVVKSLRNRLQNKQKQLYLSEHQQQKLSKQLDIFKLKKAKYKNKDVDKGYKVFNKTKVLDTTVKKIDKFNTLKDALQEIDRLRSSLNILTSNLPEGIRTTNQALHILSLAPDVNHDKKMIKEQYRMLAAIYHPDNSSYGSNEKMLEINQAFSYLIKSNRY